MLSLNPTDLQCLDHSLLFLCSTTDTALQLQHTNLLFRERFSIKEASVLPVCWPDATRIPDREKLMAAINECLRFPGRPVVVETPVAGSNGEQHWYCWEINVLTGKNEQVKGFRFVGTDITAQKNNECQLLAAKEKLLTELGQHSAFMNALMEGVLIINDKDEIIECNTAAEKILGFSAAEMTGKSVQDKQWKCIQEDGKTFPGPLYPSSQALQTGKLQRNIIMGVQRPDGGICWLCVNAQPVFGRGTGTTPSQVVCSFSDITRMKRTELALRKSEHRWKFALEGVGDGMWEYNLQTREVYYSHQYKKMIGFRETEFKNHFTEWRSRVHPDDLYIIEDIEAGYAADAIDHHAVEYRIRNKSGDYSWILDRGMVIERTPDGNPLKIIGTNKNITERKQEEERRAREEAAKKQEIVEAIISAQERERQEISFELHDNVNQLLSTGMLVLGVAENYPNNAREYIRQSKSAIQKAIDEIRKLTHNLNPATLGFVGLNASIQDVMKDINPTGKLHISFVSEGLADEKAIPPGIQLAVFRIIQEQLNNIIKHSGATHATLKLLQTENRLRLEIRDNGVGFNVQNTPKGLGLHNIFTRVELYKGSAALETSPGHGCLLKTSFPLPAPTASQP